MIGFTMPKLDQSKRFFFDRPAVTRAMDRTTRTVFSRFGGYVRLTARRSIRRRHTISPPGQPPHSPTGILRENIFYHADPFRRSVVIGPAKINRPSNAGAGKTVPELLEHGGTARRGGRTLRYQARPYMGPAYAAGLRKLDDFWRAASRRAA